jgi:hypothetical protein
MGVDNWQYAAMVDGNSHGWKLRLMNRSGYASHTSSLRPLRTSFPTMLKDLIAATEAHMQARLAETRAKFRHRGLKGGAVEDSVREFLRSYVPRRLAVGTGEVIDRNDGRSAQTDIVIANEHHPFTFSDDVPGLFFIEGVAAAGEVKAVLTSTHLESTLESSRRFKTLVAELGGSTISANEADYERFYRTPPYFLLALESQLTLDTVCKELAAKGHYGDAVAPRQVDAVFILGQGGVIDCGCGDGSFSLADANGSKVKGWAMTSRGNALFGLLAWLTMAMPREVRYEPILAKYMVGK